MFYLHLRRAQGNGDTSTGGGRVGAGSGGGGRVSGYRTHLPTCYTKRRKGGYCNSRFTELCIWGYTNAHFRYGNEKTAIVPKVVSPMIKNDVHV